MTPFLRTVCTMLTGFALSACIRETEVPSFSRTGTGDPWPEFTLTAAGKPAVRSKDLTGKTVLLVFFTTECADCRRELPVVERVWEELRDDPGFLLLPVGRNQTENTLASYWRERQWTMPFYADPDGSVYALFAERTVPRFYLASPDGIIRWEAAERLDAEGDALVELIRRIGLAVPAPDAAGHPPGLLFRSDSGCYRAPFS